ncbi:hypothetical protein [Streptomyces naphthomycinicus]|uniref:hypothetical protein n=1 Tax=Streptomyces naphthomycinicus TaxID=2872625 RepID=UPI001CEC2A37|nr:hypothetical protein [Streptomyces sp. TML10]
MSDPVTDDEREMVATALRIVADILCLDAAADRSRTARTLCTPSTVRAAESLYVQAEQLARWSGDPALLELVANAPRPDAP